MSQPIIAITVSQIHPNGINLNSLSSAYVNSVKKAGGLPLMIPNEFPLEEIIALCGRVDGVLFSGGEDVDIKLFDGEPHPEIGDPSEERDRLEIALVKEALANHLPILGICRGVQVINVALGGTLYTHIPAQFNTATEHSTPESKGKNFFAHEVNIAPDTKLARIIAKTTILVNSFHHQAIKDLAPGLMVTASSTDGLIEAVEIPGDPFTLIGVQWHPEGIQEKEEQQKLFRAFVTACNK
ncbi:MAG: putative glutamine amidotransferase [Chloroflexi bacterium]|nr:MAG: putative glutamine amidotransferase [Chloroflexota bacterium]